MIPVATTTIEVSRVAVDLTRDSYDAEPPPTIVASGVRARISLVSGRERIQGGTQEDVEFRLDCDVTDLGHLDKIVDQSDGAVYEVVFARKVLGFGSLDHMECGLRVVTGQV